MLLPLSLIFLASPVCLAGDDANPATLDDLVRQYCRNNPTREYRDLTNSIFLYGQYGHIGLRGETGEPGFPGPVGPVGLKNDTLIREAFLENLETGKRSMPRRPSSSDTAAALRITLLDPTGANL